MWSKWQGFKKSLLTWFFQKSSLALSTLLLGILFLFVGCTGGSEYTKRELAWLRKPQAMRVLCTTEMVQALVDAVGGDYVDTLALVYGELDPHSYQLVKGDDEKIAKAEIIFCNGLGLEHGPSLKSVLKRHSAVVYLGDEVAKEDPEAIIYHQETQDPHIWLDVALFAKCCPHIAKHLAKMDPPRAKEYQARAKQIVAELLAIDRDIRSQFNRIDESLRYLVTSHEAFYYLTRAYLAKESEKRSSAWRERFCAPEGLAPESQISLHRIREIATYIQIHGVKAAFLEVNVNSDAICKLQKVLASTGYKLHIPNKPLYSDSMPTIRPSEVKKSAAYSRYLELIRSNTEVIVHALGGI